MTFESQYETIMNDKEIKPGKFHYFSRMALFARFSLVLEDKNRPAVYKFTLADFQRKIPHWLPEEFEGKISDLSQLPPGYDLLASPPNKRDPDFWKIEFDGTMEGKVHIFR